MSGVKRFWIYTGIVVASFFVGLILGGHQYEVEARGSDGDDELGGLYALAGATIAVAICLACLVLIELAYRVKTWRGKVH